MVAPPDCRLGLKVTVPTWKQVVTPASLPGLLFLMVTSASRIFEATAGQRQLDPGSHALHGLSRGHAQASKNQHHSQALLCCMQGAICRAEQRDSNVNALLRGHAGGQQSVQAAYSFSQRRCYLTQA